jgi:hypothetical protein
MAFYYGGQSSSDELPVVVISSSPRNTGTRHNSRLEVVHLIQQYRAPVIFREMDRDWCESQ